MCHFLPSMKPSSFDPFHPNLRASLVGRENPTQLEGIRVLGTGSSWEAGSARHGQSRRLPGPPSREASHPGTPRPRAARGSPRKTCGPARKGPRSLQTGSGSARTPRPRARPSPPTGRELAGRPRPPRAGALPQTASGSAARPRPPAAPPPPAASVGPSDCADGPHLPEPSRPGPAALGTRRAPAAAAPPPRRLRAPPGTAASAPCCPAHLYQLQPGGGTGRLGRCSPRRPSAVRFSLGYHVGAGYPAVGGQAPSSSFPRVLSLLGDGEEEGRASSMSSSEAGNVALATDSRPQALP